MIISQMLSSRCACSAMKKNRPSRQCLTGRTDSAYAAGIPRSSTRTVEPTVAMIECVRNGLMPVTASRNSDKVGVKMNLGGQVSAADSGLNAVSTIHSTGRKNVIATTHARIVQPTCPDHWRNLRGPGRSDTVVMLCLPLASYSCLLELEDPGEHAQRERGHDDRQDD